MAYKHNGFWQCMDTLRDKIFLDEYFKKKEIEKNSYNWPWFFS